MSESLERLKAALADRYRIEREIGAGGMATVYLARDLRHERQVAVKVLRPDLAATVGSERFLQEVRVTANLQHPHILPLFDSGEADGFLYFVMPYIEGESLRQRLVREGELPVPEAARLVRDVVDALAAAHAKGVVHRDIKPENVMLSGHHAMVTDFGVAKAVSEATGRHHLTTEGVALGTPVYMAPEQAAGEPNVDQRADIYAVGVLAYELLAGRPPFGGATAQQILAAQVIESPQPLREHRASVPPALEAVVMRCLEKKPADRWQSAEEILAHLESALTPTAGVTPTDLLPMTGTIRKRRGLRLWLSAAVFTVLMVIVALWWQTRGGGAGHPGAAADAGEPDRLVVMPLENITGDSALDVWGMLASDEIGRAIDRTGSISVLPADVVHDAVRTLREAASATSVARRLQASHAIAGRLAHTRDQVRFEVEFLDVRTGERVVALEPVVGSMDSVEVVVGKLAEAAAAAAMARLDPEAPRWGGSVPVRLDAYRDYLRQRALFCQYRYSEAIEAGNRALEKDPGYVMALLGNGGAYENSGRHEEADSVFSELEALRDRMTAIERLQLDYWVAYVGGNARDAARTAEEMYRVAPTPWGYIAGLESVRGRRLEDAIERFLAVDSDIPCGRDWVSGWTAPAGAYHLLGHYDEELEFVRGALQQYPGNVSLMQAEIRAFAATDRLEAVDSLLDVVASLPPSDDDPNLRAVLAALELRAHGHPEAAEAAFGRAFAGYAAQSPAQHRYNRGRAFYYAGRWADADTLFAVLIRTAPDNIDYRGYRGVALARLGRLDEALEIDRWMEAVPERPGLRGTNRGWRAIIHAALGDRQEAVRLMQEAFDHLYPYGVWVHREPAFDNMWGYPPWEALLAPR